MRKIRVLFIEERELNAWQAKKIAVLLLEFPTRCKFLELEMWITDLS